MRPDGSDQSCPPDKGGFRGLFPSSTFIPYQKRLVALARELRSNLTPFEFIVWTRLLRVPPFDIYKFLRQKPLLNYIIDFYCPKLLLAIEIDGDTHNEQVTYDERRTQDLGRYGIIIVRYQNAEVVSSLDGIGEDLWRIIQNRVQELLLNNPSQPPLIRGGA